MPVARLPVSCPCPPSAATWHGGDTLLPLLAVCWPYLQGSLPLILLKASPGTLASLILSPQLFSDFQPASSSLLTAPGISLPHSQSAPRLCLSLSSCVDITSRNIRSMLNFSSTSSSSVLSIFALAGLSTCIETYTRNFNYSFGPSLSLPLWPFLLSLSAEFSRFC